MFMAKLNGPPIALTLWNIVPLTKDFLLTVSTSPGDNVVPLEPHLSLSIKNKLLSPRGVTGKCFWGGNVIFSDFFPGVKCFFPVENFHFGRPKPNFSGFDFQVSTFPFTIFLLFFSIFTPFPFFPCLVFSGRSAEISRSEVSRGHSAPLPPSPRYATAFTIIYSSFVDPSSCQ